MSEVGTAPGDRWSGATVTVRGEWQADYPPDRATLDLSVVGVDADRATVLADVAASAERVRAAIGVLHDGESGPVTSWSSDQIRIWFQDEWDKAGNSRPPQHHATVKFSVVFGDFIAMSATVDEMIGWDLVQVDYVRWDLTPARQRETEREVRRRAVDDAQQRAEDYAEAAGLGSLVVESVADRGMLDSAQDWSGQPRRMSGASAVGSFGMGARGDGPAFSYVPQDVTVSAAVDMRFRATV